MALGDSYATLEELKNYLTVPDTVDDTELESALASASRDIDKTCGRQFNDAGTATARVFYPDGWDLVKVDDFSTTTGLIVKTDDGNDGTYETTWDSIDYQLEPLNGIVDGETGWPYNRIRAVGSRCFPTWCLVNLPLFRAPIQITAQWGWAAVPAPVKQACLIIASETFKLRDAPFGVAGYGDFGPVRVRNNPMAMSKLGPYIRDRVMVA